MLYVQKYKSLKQPILNVSKNKKEAYTQCCVEMKTKCTLYVRSVEKQDYVF